MTRRLSYRCRQQARPSTTTTTSFVDNAIDFPWRNFSSSVFGTKFQGEVAQFWRYPNFFITQCGIGGRKPMCQKSSIRPVVSIKYRLVTDGRTDTRRQHIQRASRGKKSLMIERNVNSALHPSGVAKSSTSFGWDKGGNVSYAGWQVTLCDPIWHVSFRSGEACCELSYSVYLYLFTSTLPTRMQFEVWTRVGQSNHVSDGGPDPPPQRKGQIFGWGHPLLCGLS